MPLPRMTSISLQPRSGDGSAHPYGADARCVPCKVLKTASRAVLSRWTRRPRSTGPDEVAQVLGFIDVATHETWFDSGKADAPPPKVDQRVNSSLGRRLLEQLRGQVVEGWRDGGVPDAELLPLLVAMERVRVAIEPSWAQTFAQNLSGSDGLALLTDVAHDLRSPLTSILFLAETMQRGQSGPVTDVQRRQLGLIYTAALGLSSVASDIIDLTRSQMLVELKPVPFSVGGVLESVHDIVRPIAEEKQLAVRLIPPSLDERLGHPVALSRVLLNLTTNALKFTSQGYVEISARDITPGRIEFAVTDSGKGIDAATMPTLFDSVRRARVSGEYDDHVAKLFSQTGLGLTICRKLVATMGSELQVESRVGWGTRFHFTLELPPCPSRRPASRISGPGRRTAERRAQRRTPN